MTWHIVVLTIYTVRVTLSEQPRTKAPTGLTALQLR
jgi:hypothetical protein